MPSMCCTDRLWQQFYDWYSHLPSSMIKLGIKIQFFTRSTIFLNVASISWNWEILKCQDPLQLFFERSLRRHVQFFITLYIWWRFVHFRELKWRHDTQYNDTQCAVMLSIIYADCYAGCRKKPFMLNVVAPLK